MKLLNLVVGDEFTVPGSADVYQLIPTDDSQFLQTGCLTVKNTKTGQTGMLPENANVVLFNFV